MGAAPPPPPKKKRVVKKKEISIVESYRELESQIQVHATASDKLVIRVTVMFLSRT
jgi:hypothetical protein